jgi:hypothetical protein
MMHCPRCGYISPLTSGHDSCHLCGSVMPGSGHTPFKTTIYSDGIPWESHETVQSPLKAIVHTFVRSFSRHERFFAAASRGTEWHGALIYGLLMGSAGTLASVLWEFVSPFSISGMLEADGILSGSADSLSPVTLMLTPLALLIMIGAMTLYCQSMLWITGSRKRPLRATFKTVCYIQGASLFQFIPFAGVVISFIAMLYLLVNGFHATHEISRHRAFMVLVLPIILISILIAAIFLLLFLFLAVSGGSQTDPFSLFRFR